MDSTLQPTPREAAPQGKMVPETLAEKIEIKTTDPKNLPNQANERAQPSGQQNQAPYRTDLTGAGASQSDAAQGKSSGLKAGDQKLVTAGVSGQQCSGQQPRIHGSHNGHHTHGPSSANAD
ncbi:MAG: hypothetical protein HC848_08855 [Limnobacter sp.]|nr:hypothetical protein [Limnobacter sp.]